MQRCSNYIKIRGRLSNPPEFATHPPPCIDMSEGTEESHCTEGTMQVGLNICKCHAGLRLTMRWGYSITHGRMGLSLPNYSLQGDESPLRACSLPQFVSRFGTSTHSRSLPNHCRFRGRKGVKQTSHMLQADHRGCSALLISAPMLLAFSACGLWQGKGTGRKYRRAASAIRGDTVPPRKNRSSAHGQVTGHPATRLPLRRALACFSSFAIKARQPG